MHFDRAKKLNSSQNMYVYVTVHADFRFFVGVTALEILTLGRTELKILYFGKVSGPPLYNL